MVGSDKITVNSGDGRCVQTGPRESSTPTTSALQTRLDQLYSERFILSKQGIPSVTIGVTDRQQQIFFRPLNSTIATIYQADGSSRQIRLRAKQRYSVAIVKAKAAQLRYAVVAFSLRQAQWHKWPEIAQTWTQRGFQVQPHQTGSVFAIRGVLFDNRQRLGVLAFHSQLAQARKQAAHIAENWQHQVEISEILKRRPVGMLRLSAGQRQWFSQSLIELRPCRDGIQVERVEFGRGYSWHRHQQRTFLGALLFTPDRYGQLALINKITLPNYLQGLLASEMPINAPIEALKAQSICARNEILSKIGTRHLADPYLFCAHTHCQVYTGVHREQAKIANVVSATRGEVMLTKDGQLADASYSAICGGHTEHYEHVWGGLPRSSVRGKLDTRSALPHFRDGISSHNIHHWLSSAPSSYCSNALPQTTNRFRWSRHYTAVQLNQLVQRQFPIDSVRELEVLHRGISGRATLLRIADNRQSISIQGELRIRQLLGNIPSSMFVIQAQRNAHRQISSWILHGGGWGHGVGMCQHGAIGRAQAGFSYHQILQHYFSEVALRRLY